MPPLTHWIGGERLDGDRHRDVTNPASAEVIGRVPMADAAIVERAIEAARAAQPAGQARPGDVPLQDAAGARRR